MSNRRPLPFQQPAPSPSQPTSPMQSPSDQVDAEPVNPPFRIPEPEPGPSAAPATTTATPVPVTVPASPAPSPVTSGPPCSQVYTTSPENLRAMEQALLQREAALRAEQARHNPTAQSLIHQLIRTSMSRDQKFYLVKIPDGESPTVEVFDDIEAQINRIIDLMQTDTFVFPFMGYAFGITRGPLRYMVTPFGMLPLYRLPSPDEVEVEQSGWLGSEEPISIPQTPPGHIEAAPLPARVTEAGAVPPDDTPVVTDLAGG